MAVYLSTVHDDLLTELFDVTTTMTNLDVTTSQPTPSSTHLQQCSGFQFVLNTVVIGLLCVFGLAGNTVSILVLQKDRSNRVPVFLLQSLAVADNFVLCLSFIVLSIFFGLMPMAKPEALERAHPYVIAYLNPLGYIAQSCVIWFTVLLAINRYVAICRPFSAQGCLTMLSARIQVGCVLLVSTLVNAPRFFQYRIRDASEMRNNPGIISNSSFASNSSSSFNKRNFLAKSSFGGNWYFEMVYLNIFYTSCFLVLPLILLVCLNIPLVRDLQASKRLMKQSSLYYSGRQENNITVVMIIIILELVICHAPDRVIQIILILVKATTSGRQLCPSPLFYAVNIANMLVISNSSTDFIVYYIFRSRFRSILFHRVCCCCRTRPRASSIGDGYSENGENGSFVRPSHRLKPDRDTRHSSCPVVELQKDGFEGMHLQMDETLLRHPRESLH